MRVDFVIGKDAVQALRKVLHGLANGLTAAENFAPEGVKGQILTSNGKGTPPSYQDILGGISNGGAKGEKGEKGDMGPTGPVGPTGPSGANGMVPTYIAEGDSFTIPVDRQALFALDIVVDGTLVVDGFLVEVS
jgi:hypothetical protein